MPQHLLQLDTERTGDAVHVVARGELDLSTAQELTALLAGDECADAERIVLDLSAVTFIDSTGLVALLQAEARVAPGSGRLTIIPSEIVERLVDLSVVRERLPLAGADGLDEPDGTPSGAAAAR